MKARAIDFFGIRKRKDRCTIVKKHFFQCELQFRHSSKFKTSLFPERGELLFCKRSCQNFVVLSSWSLLHALPLSHDRIVGLSALGFSLNVHYIHINVAVNMKC